MFSFLIVLTATRLLREAADRVDHKRCGKMSKFQALGIRPSSGFYGDIRPSSYLEYNYPKDYNLGHKESQRALNTS